MTRSLLFLFIAFLFAACNRGGPEKILPAPRMQAVLWDVMRADELASYYAQKDSSFNDMLKHTDYYQEIFRIHHISKNDFSTSLQYYLANPAQFKIILDSLQSFAEKAQRQSPSIAVPVSRPDTIDQHVPLSKKEKMLQKLKTDTVLRKKALLRVKDRV